MHLADFVADLTDAQWSTPSLCEAWTVRDVIAHLTTTTRTDVAAAGEGGGPPCPGQLQPDGGRSSPPSGRRGTPPVELVDQLRESAQSSNGGRSPAAPMDPLMDLVIHAQDIARPLRTPTSRHRRWSPPRSSTSPRTGSWAGHGGWPGSGWSRPTPGGRLGEGAELRGPDIDLLLVAAGRPAGLTALDGPGKAIVADRG